MSTQQEAEKRILELQRDLMTEILDYQIAYGPGTIVWNVQAQFIRMVKIPDISQNKGN
jgi:hypothetical protein